MTVHVDQVAYDRFVLDLPEADTAAPLADAEVAHEAAAWLWEYGPTPLVGLVRHDGPAPAWLAAAREVVFDGAKATVSVLTDREALERFLAAGGAHERTRLLWPRRSEARLVEALALGSGRWIEEIDAQASVVRGGRAIEVVQVTT